MPAGIPTIVVREPPVAAAVEPVPSGRLDTIAAVTRPLDLVLDLGLRHRRAEQVLGLDLGGNLFAQHHRLGRGVDLHLKLGLFVLLDAEVAPPLAIDSKLVHPQRGVDRQFILAVQPAIFVGLKRLFKDLVPLGAVDEDQKVLPGEIRDVILIVPGVANPELELDRLLGPVDGRSVIVKTLVTLYSAS